MSKVQRIVYTWAISIVLQRAQKKELAKTIAHWTTYFIQLCFFLLRLLHIHNFYLHSNPKWSYWSVELQSTFLFVIVTAIIIMSNWWIWKILCDYFFLLCCTLYKLRFYLSTENMRINSIELTNKWQIFNIDRKKSSIEILMNIFSFWYRSTHFIVNFGYYFLQYILFLQYTYAYVCVFFLHFNVILS